MQKAGVHLHAPESGSVTEFESSIAQGQSAVSQAFPLESLHLKRFLFSFVPLAVDSKGAFVSPQKEHPLRSCIRTAWLRFSMTQGVFLKLIVCFPQTCLKYQATQKYWFWSNRLLSLCVCVCVSERERERTLVSWLAVSAAAPPSQRRILLLLFSNFHIATSNLFWEGMMVDVRCKTFLHAPLRFAAFFSAAKLWSAASIAVLFWVWSVWGNWLETFKRRCESGGPFTNLSFTRKPTRVVLTEINAYDSAWFAKLHDTKTLFWCQSGCAGTIIQGGKKVMLPALFRKIQQQFTW